VARYYSGQAVLTKSTKTCHDSQYASQASHKHKYKPLQLKLWKMVK